MILNTGNGHGLLLDVCDFIVGGTGGGSGRKPEGIGCGRGRKAGAEIEKAIVCCLVLLISHTTMKGKSWEKGRKSTGGERAWFAKREAVTPLSLIF